jgi:hypothetical protein
VRKFGAKSNTLRGFSSFKGMRLSCGPSTVMHTRIVSRGDAKPTHTRVTPMSSDDFGVGVSHRLISRANCSVTIKRPLEVAARRLVSIIDGLTYPSRALPMSGGGKFRWFVVAASDCASSAREPPLGVAEVLARR